MISKHTIWTLLLAVAVAALSLPARAAETLVLATTTSTDNTGLLAHIHRDFEKRTGLRVKVVAKGTGASLRLARDGNADVVLVHARNEEDKFMAEGFGAVRRDVMYNDFILVGPAADPAGVKQAPTAAAACGLIAKAPCPFISRGDDSGTHIKEQALWRRSGVPVQTVESRAVVEGKDLVFRAVRPTGDWYLSIGQGMGKTLSVATEKRAYALADRGTYYAFALSQPPKTNLAILFAGGNDLQNPYGIIAVSPQKHPHVNYAGAMQYVAWITSPATQQMIGAFQVQGKTLFFPSAKPSLP